MKSVIIKIVALLGTFLSITNSAPVIEKEAPPPCLSFEPPLRTCLNVTKWYGVQQHQEDSVVDWSHVVIFIMMYNDTTVDALLQGHYDTWLQQVNTPGLDVYLITDVWDERSTDQILPYGAAGARSLVNYHIYKSPAHDEGKHLRFKTIDSISKLWRIYRANEKKKYFVKIDTDTFVLPENLLTYLNKIEHATNRAQPVLFGKVICSFKSMCYASGSLYGMNKRGLQSLAVHFHKHPHFHQKQVHLKNPDGSRGTNLMKHEDFMISYAYHTATGFPVINNLKIFNFHIEREGVGGEEHPPICYHGVKDARGMYEYYKLFYTKNKMHRLQHVVKLWKNREESHYQYLHEDKMAKNYKSSPLKNQYIQMDGIEK